MGLPMGQKLVKFATNGVQTLRNAYLWNCWMDLHHLKFHGLLWTCSCATSQLFSLLPHMGLPMGQKLVKSGSTKARLCGNLDFQGQILKMLYLRNGKADWHRTKGMWVDRMLDPHCDFELWPHPWPWPWIFKDQFWKSHNSGMGCLIHMERKGCEWTECWTPVVPLNFDLTHDLDLEFLGQILKMLYLRNGRTDWHGSKGMWVTRMLDSHCDFKFWPHPWPWPWIFKVNF